MCPEYIDGGGHSIVADIPYCKTWMLGRPGNEAMVDNSACEHLPYRVNLYSPSDLAGLV